MLKRLCHDFVNFHPSKKVIYWARYLKIIAQLYFFRMVEIRNFLCNQEQISVLFKHEEYYGQYRFKGENLDVFLASETLHESKVSLEAEFSRSHVSRTQLVFF